jgi:KaiC/GvpD/RAD55 family RecA-like ATPase/tetratricopeptide (TPR) repeat protein
MSQRGLQSFVKKARKEERECQWLAAAESYVQGLSSGTTTGDSARSDEAKIRERIGFCYSLASRQTERGEEFRRLMRRAIEAYKKAAQLLEKQGSVKEQGKSAQCNAMAAYLGSWLASDPSKKREMLDDCVKSGRKSLDAYERAGDELCYGKMCSDLLLPLFERLYIALDSKDMREIAEEGVNYANKAITILSKLGSKSELLRAYFAASLQGWYAANVTEQEEKSKELAQRSLSYSDEALKLCEHVNDHYYSAMSNWAAAFCTLLFTDKVESSLQYAKEMLEEGTTVRDNYLQGVAYYVLAFVTNWMMVREEDPDKKKRENEEIIKYAENAISHLGPVCQDLFIAETYLFYSESYSSLANNVEYSLEQRRDMLRKGVEIGRTGLEHASRSGSSDALLSTLHALSKALHFCSNFETGRDEKMMLLEEALARRQEYDKLAERLVPANDWIRGVGQNYEGLIGLDLARQERNRDKKVLLLENAVKNMEDGLNRCQKHGRWLESPTLIAAVGTYEDGFGTMLNELCILTNDKGIPSKTIEAHKDAAMLFKKVNLMNRAAESYWKMARMQDSQGEHLEAAESFENAQAEYKTAALRTSHFEGFYFDYASYMEAWAEIERAKSAHEHEEYAIAVKHYAKVAGLLEKSKVWGYQSSNFRAWSLLEEAEDSSREGKSIESAETFKKAVELFKTAREVFEKQIDKIQNIDERTKAAELCKASLRRMEYCLARVSIEEARMCDQKGEYVKSAEKYGLAASCFEKMLETMETESERREMKPIACMCRAWQKMKMADGRVSPELYHEASELFLEAKQYDSRDRTILLALGNSSFCRALEHGARFEGTREKDDFSRTKQYLESAASYYLKAGYESASTWTNATEVLFDAYNYLICAELESDPEKKMKQYLVAERCLKKSAGLYETAGYVGKRGEVLKILGRVEQKREFALSLGGLLAAPSEVSSTQLVPAPNLTVEEPVGLSKFDHAFVRANVVAPQKELKAGEDLHLRLELINVGKSPAFLTEIAEVVPQGFDLVQEPEMYSVEDSSLNMKGKQLNPLKTDEIRVVLRSFEKGSFAVKPKITYLDEGGNRTSCEPDPVTITVSEAVLPSRVATEYGNLDKVLFGGIPENYTVILTSPSCDEKELLVRRFLEAGAKKGEVVFCVTALGEVKSLAEEFQSTFHLFICNPRADTMIESFPNVSKLKGIENLNEINIALAKAFEGLDARPKRAYIGIVSDVLLQHHAIQTRRWLTNLIPNLKSRGFTTLVAMNPQMHSSEEVQAILDLFEGEISIYGRETGKGLQTFLKIKKMHNQKYIEGELLLRKEKL